MRDAVGASSATGGRGASKTPKVDCRLCRAPIAHTFMRAHVGQHQLLKTPVTVSQPPASQNDLLSLLSGYLLCIFPLIPRKDSTPSHRLPSCPFCAVLYFADVQINYWESSADICGFCGLVGSCETSVRVQRKVEKIVSTCSYAPKPNPNSNEVEMGVKRARTSTETSPCTNLPLECMLCSSRKQKVCVWKYCMPAHIRQVHGGPDSLEARESRHADFIASCLVSEKEMTAVKALKVDTGRKQQAGRKKQRVGAASSRRSASEHARGGASASSPGAVRDVTDVHNTISI